MKKSQIIYIAFYLFLLTLGIFMSSCSSPSADRYAREQAQKQLDNVQEQEQESIVLAKYDIGRSTDVKVIEIDNVQYVVVDNYNGIAIIKHEPKAVKQLDNVQGLLYGRDFIIRGDSVIFK